jgi:hypothetical protein
MKNAISRRTTAAIIAACVGLGGYIGSYFATTEVFYGQIGDESMDFRLFGTPAHLALFRPLIWLEGQYRSAQGLEFHSHIRNGASLPPPRFAAE